MNDFDPYADFSDADKEILSLVSDESMASPERLHSVISAVRYVTKNRIQGSIAECGVFRGGAMMAAAATMLQEDEERDLFLFDTYEGLPPPTAEDVNLVGESASTKYEVKKQEDDDRWLCVSQAELVEANIERTGFNMEKVELVPGLVEDTLPHPGVKQLAILRIDVDWYEPTLHVLEHLFPLLSPGGVLLLDDYGHWLGSKKAVDVYFEQNNIPFFLSRVDYTGRTGVKL